MDGSRTHFSYSSVSAPAQFDDAVRDDLAHPPASFSIDPRPLIQSIIVRKARPILPMASASLALNPYAGRISRFYRR
jgi:hypothetical protein